MDTNSNITRRNYGIFHSLILSAVLSFTVTPTLLQADSPVLCISSCTHLPAISISARCRRFFSTESEFSNALNQVLSPASGRVCRIQFDAAQFEPCFSLGDIAVSLSRERSKQQSTKKKEIFVSPAKGRRFRITNTSRVQLRPRPYDSCLSF